MFLSDDAPLEVLNQNSKDLFYEPMFRDVVKRYLKLRKGDEQEELEEFVNDSEQATLCQLNVRTILSESRPQHRR